MKVNWGAKFRNRGWLTAFVAALKDELKIDNAAVKKVLLRFSNYLRWHEEKVINIYDIIVYKIEGMLLTLYGNCEPAVFTVNVSYGIISFG